MKLKKLLAIALMATAVTLTACGGDSKKAESNATTEAAKEEKKEYTPGEFTDTGYDSEFLGFRYTTPEGFKLSTREELDSLMDVAMDAVDDNMNAIQKKYAELTVIYEMMVMNETGSANANITLEKTSVSVDKYIESFKSQASELTGMNITFEGDAEEVEVAGATYKKLTGSVDASGVTIKQEYYFREVGDRLMTMTVTNMGDDAGVEALMAGFAAY